MPPHRIFLDLTSGSHNATASKEVVDLTSDTDIDQRLPEASHRSTTHATHRHAGPFATNGRSQGAPLSPRNVRNLSWVSRPGEANVMPPQTKHAKDPSPLSQVLLAPRINDSGVADMVEHDRHARGEIYLNDSPLKRKRDTHGDEANGIANHRRKSDVLDTSAATHETTPSQTRKSANPIGNARFRLPFSSQRSKTSQKFVFVGSSDESSEENEPIDGERLRNSYSIPVGRKKAFNRNFGVSNLAARGVEPAHTAVPALARKLPLQGMQGSVINNGEGIPKLSSPLINSQHLLQPGSMNSHPRPDATGGTPSERISQPVFEKSRQSQPSLATTRRPMLSKSASKSGSMFTMVRTEAPGSGGLAVKRVRNSIGPREHQTPPQVVLQHHGRKSKGFEHTDGDLQMPKSNREGDHEFDTPPGSIVASRSVRQTLEENRIPSSHVSSTQTSQHLQHLDVPPKRISRRTFERLVPHSANDRSASEATHDSFLDPTASPATDLHLKQVEEKLADKLDALEQAHHNHTKSALRRARYASSQSPSPPYAEKWRQNESPFRINMSRSKSAPGKSRPGFIPLKLEKGTEVKRSAFSKPGPNLPVAEFTSHTVSLPPYTHCTRLGSNLLAENERNLIAFPVDDRLPHLSDLDFKTDLLESYTRGDPDGREQVVRIMHRRKFLEPAILAFLATFECSADDVLRFFIDPHEKQAGLEGVKKTRDLQKAARKESDIFNDFDEWDPILSSLPATTEENQEVVRMACTAVQTACKMSLWGFVESRAVELLSSAVIPAETSSLKQHASLVCRICHMYDCTYHGSFDEAPFDADNDALQRHEMSENHTSSSKELEEDHILGYNFKHRARSTAYQKLSEKPECEDSQASPDTRIPSSRDHRTSRSRRSGSLGPNSQSDGAPTFFDDPYRCSKTCALDRKGMDAQPFTDIEATLRRFTPKERELARSFLPAFGDSTRGSCWIAKVLKKPCSHVAHLLESLKGAEPMLLPQPTISGIDQRNGPNRRNWEWFKHLAPHSINWWERGPFYPCQHDGTCEDAQCRCFREKIVCEKTCACSLDCQRRFRGCDCARANLTCWNNVKCDCFRMSRECDPDLCETCEAAEVLAPANRYEDERMTKRCANVAIQRGLPKRLIVGESQVSGFGLFAGQAIKKYEFLGEYVGELICKEEAYRRKAFYQYSNREYTFDLNRDQELDGTYTGNKIRYLNNSSSPMHINCVAQPLLCNTVSRLGLYATRDIKPGEELLFNYGYPEDKIAHFKEPTTVVSVRTKKTASRTGNPVAGILSKNKDLALFEDGSTDNDVVDSASDGQEGSLLRRILEKLENESDDDDDFVDSEAEHSSRPSRASKRIRLVQSVEKKHKRR